MKILPCGIAVLEGDMWASRWIEEQSRLDYDPTISQVLEPMLRPGDTAIDAGAMLGAYAFGFKRAVGPTGRVIAFEPNPKAFECLVRNCPGVECFRYALSDRTENMEFEDGGANAGKFRLIPWFKTDHDFGTQAHSLDEFLTYYPIKSLRLLKIDVEGMEPRVIQGAIATITKYSPIIYIEVNHKALELNGYNWHDVIDPLINLRYTPRHLKEGLSFYRDKCPEIDVIMMP